MTEPQDPARPRRLRRPGIPANLAAARVPVLADHVTIAGPGRPSALRRPAVPAKASCFRDPVIWLLLAIVAGVAEIVAFVLLDQDLIEHDRAEVGVEYELSVIYGRLGQHLPSPDQGRVKRPDNHVGRILAWIFSFGIYLFWCYYNQMQEPNKHFAINWTQEDELVKAVGTVS
jgi:hypothetical protein